MTLTDTTQILVRAFTSVQQRCGCRIFLALLSAVNLRTPLRLFWGFTPNSKCRTAQHFRTQQAKALTRLKIVQRVDRSDPAPPCGDSRGGENGPSQSGPECLSVQPNVPPSCCLCSTAFQHCVPTASSLSVITDCLH